MRGKYQIKSESVYFPLWRSQKLSESEKTWQKSCRNGQVNYLNLEALRALGPCWCRPSWCVNFSVYYSYGGCSNRHGCRLPDIRCGNATLCHFCRRGIRGNRQWRQWQMPMTRPGWSRIPELRTYILLIEVLIEVLYSLVGKRARRGRNWSLNCTSNYGTDDMLANKVNGISISAKFT